MFAATVTGDDELRYADPAVAVPPPTSADTPQRPNETAAALRMLAPGLDAIAALLSLTQPASRTAG